MSEAQPTRTVPPVPPGIPPVFEDWLAEASPDVLQLLGGRLYDIGYEDGVLSYPGVEV